MLFLFLLCKCLILCHANVGHAIFVLKLGWGYVLGSENVQEVVYFENWNFMVMGFFCTCHYLYFDLVVIVHTCYV